MSHAGTFSLAKRVVLSPEEQLRFEREARSILADIGAFSANCSLQPMALSDTTQTWRVFTPEARAVLKIGPPAAADLALRIQAFFENRGIEMPPVLWHDAKRGYVLYADLGIQSTPDPKVGDLTAIVLYLARLHSAGSMSSETARLHFPDLALQGFPTPARMAGLVLHRARGLEDALRDRLSEAALLLSEWVEADPRLIVSDVKREHFCFRQRQPLLVDLELASFWDLAPANLATLLSFPRQYAPMLDRAAKDQLLSAYIKSRELCDGVSIDLDRLSRGVAACEFLLALELAQVGILTLAEWRQLTGGGLAAPLPSCMVRNRPLHSTSESRSIEEELGSACFSLLSERLNRPGSIHVLDVGCGNGDAVRQLRERWPRHHVLGFDLYPGQGIPGIAKADARNLPAASCSIDVLLATQLLQYLPDKLAFLAEVYRVLKLDGLAVFAMTEHFDPESGFNPALPQLMERAKPQGVIHVSHLHSVRAREVLSFAMTRGSEPLQFGCEFVGAVPRDDLVGLFPYLQSRYRLTPIRSDNQGKIDNRESLT
jgi:SAM-dependent methyltransferase